MTDRSRQMPDPQTATVLAIAAMHRLVADDAEFLHHLNADTEEAFGGDFDA